MRDDKRKYNYGFNINRYQEYNGAAKSAIVKASIS